MSWVDMPKIAPGQPITPDQWNDWIPGNMEALLDQPLAEKYFYNISSLYGITATQWKPLPDSAGTDWFSVDITTEGGPVFVHANVHISLSQSNQYVAMRLSVDGQPRNAHPFGQGLLQNSATATQRIMPLTITEYIPDLEAGDHVITLEYRVFGANSGVIRFGKLIAKELS